MTSKKNYYKKSPYSPSQRKQKDVVPVANALERGVGAAVFYVLSQVLKSSRQVNYEYFAQRKPVLIR